MRSKKVWPWPLYCDQRPRDLRRMHIFTLGQICTNLHQLAQILFANFVPLWKLLGRRPNPDHCGAARYLAARSAAQFLVSYIGNILRLCYDWFHILVIYWGVCNDGHGLFPDVYSDGANSLSHISVLHPSPLSNMHTHFTQVQLLGP